MRNLPNKILLGARFLKGTQAVLNWRGSCLQVSLIVDGVRVQPEAAIVEDVGLVKEFRDEINSLDLSEFSRDVQDRERLRRLILEFREVFTGVGTISGVEHHIKLAEGAAPYCAPLRRRAPKELSTERELVRRLLKDGILEPTGSPSATYNVLVPKVKGGYRLTTDFRRLNSVTEPNSFPLEDVRTVLDWLGSKKVLTTMDLKDSFFQVRLAESSRPLTAVRTPEGLLQYTRMPQGLRNSPGTLQRVINETLGDWKGSSALSYVDDLTVGSEDAEEHLQDLREVLSRLKARGVRLNPEKCKFGRRRMEILGHEVGPEGVKPNDGHLKVIREFPEPTAGSHYYGLSARADTSNHSYRICQGGHSHCTTC